MALYAFAVWIQLADDTGTSQDLIFTDPSAIVQTGSGDTPASISSYPLLDLASVRDQVPGYKLDGADIRPEGWAVQSISGGLRFDNSAQYPDGTGRPFDAWDDWQWSGAEVRILYAPVPPTGAPAWSSFVNVTRGFVGAPPSGDDTVTLQVETLDETAGSTELASVRMDGLGGLVRYTGTGQTLTRANHSGFQSTGDFTEMMRLRVLADPGTGFVVNYESNQTRWSINSDFGDIRVRLLEPARVGTLMQLPTYTLGEWITVAVVWDATAQTGTMFADGVQVGSATSVGTALDTASRTSQWYLSASSWEVDVAFYRRYNQKLTAAQIYDRHRSPIDPVVETDLNLTAAFELNDRVGSVAYDSALNQNGILAGWSPIDDAWESTETGEVEQAGEAVPVAMGIVPGAPLVAVDNVFKRYVMWASVYPKAGSAFTIMANGEALASLDFSGAAAYEPIVEADYGVLTLPAAYSTFTSADKQMTYSNDPVRYWAIGQTVNVGDNNPFTGPTLPTTVTVRARIVDPALSYGGSLWGSNRGPILVNETLPDTSENVTLAASSGDGLWYDAKVRHDSVFTWTTVRLSSDGLTAGVGNAEALVAFGQALAWDSVLGDYDTLDEFWDSFSNDFGSTIAKRYYGASPVDRVSSLLAPSDSDFLSSGATLAIAKLAPGGLPGIITHDGDGTFTVTGLAFASSASVSIAHTISESMIDRVGSVARRGARAGRVRVLFAHNRAPLEKNEVSGAARDDVGLIDRITRAYSSATSGAAGRTMEWPTELLRRNHAQQMADQLLALQGGELRRVFLHPLTPPTAYGYRPGDLITIDNPRPAAWSGGAEALILAIADRRVLDDGTVAVALDVWTAE